MKLDIKEYGAIGDGCTLTTKALQQAIDDAAKQAATVVVSPGTYLCGSLFLKKGMTLEIQKDAVLLGSPCLDDYVIANTRFEGRTCTWPLALLNAQDIEGVHVYGEGVLDGNGIPFYTEFWEQREQAIASDKPFSNRDVMRPRILFIERCSSVVIEGITLRNSAFWNFHLYDSSNIIVRGITIQAPHEGVRAASSDAIDIDACQHVVIRDCNFSTDDDCVCIKGGKGPDAHLANTPTEDILVENCRFGFGHGVITFGSEASIVRNVRIRSCVVEGENTLVRYKFRGDTYQHFEHMLFEDITIRNGGWLFDVRPWISRQDELFGENQMSVVSDLVIRNITATGMQSPGVLGESSDYLKLEGIVLQSITFTSAPDATGSLVRADVHEKQEAPVGVLSYDTSGDIVFSDVNIDGEMLTHA
nr:glycosyl hydrolase family 28 protein [uncultured Sphaerochaeta sp.]